MTKRIPKAAKPIVEKIRELVPRPTNLPSLTTTNTDDPVLRWTWPRRPSNQCCPLGLLPNALVGVPVGPQGTGLWPGHDMDWEEWRDKDSSVSAFIGWWDAQTDPQAAVNAVWGKA